MVMLPPSAIVRVHQIKAVQFNVHIKNNSITIQFTVIFPDVLREYAIQNKQEAFKQTNCYFTVCVCMCVVQCMRANDVTSLIFYTVRGKK